MLSQDFSSYVEALTKISKAICSDLYLEDILRLIVTVTAEVMQSKIVSLMLLDEKKGKLFIRATQSVSEEYNKKPPLKVGEGIAGKVVQTNRPIAVYDVRKEAEYKYKNIAEILPLPIALPRQRSMFLPLLPIRQLWLLRIPN